MASSKENVTFVLVPGSFSTPFQFSIVTSLLQNAPYSFAPSAFRDAPLQSATPSRPEGPATMHEDAAAIASVITAAADEGNDVVLVMSSYGGFPGTEAAFGLSKASRAKKGLKGGIISLVYIASFMAKIGQSIHDFSEGVPGEDEYMHIDYTPEMAGAVFNDAPNPEDQKKYFDSMNDHSRISFDGQLKHEGWREVKSYYFHTKRDLIVSPDIQKRLISAAKDEGADLEVIETDFGHVPMLGSEASEKAVADLLVKAAGL